LWSSSSSGKRARATWSGDSEGSLRCIAPRELVCWTPPWRTSRWWIKHPPASFCACGWNSRSGASQQYYAHIVLWTEPDLHAQETKYWIGNIEQRPNGWCYREHIFGILVGVQVDYEDRYYFRPHPKSVYEDVKWHVGWNRWSGHARALCEPDWRQWEETF
jgi:hypothetical protein